MVILYIYSTSWHMKSHFMSANYRRWRLMMHTMAMVWAMVLVLFMVMLGVVPTLVRLMMELQPWKK
jgi:hypothetical protein